MTGHSVTTKEAAEALGISVEAVRKRIERGQLGHERIDGRVYVYLDDNQTKSGLDVEVDGTPPEVDGAEGMSAVAAILGAIESEPLGRPVGRLEMLAGSVTAAQADIDRALGLT